MATVDANKQILSASASYAADDWARVGAEGSLDLNLNAVLLRGLNIGAGAEAGVRLEGGLSEYVSADAQGSASAAVNVQAQVQVPLDLFKEAGLAIRLQAKAEAAAGVSLAIGLNVGDFLALAQQDRQMQGVPIELLKIFLSELEIQGGVMAKAAAAAMAYANIAMTGRLTRSGDDLPGFTVAADAGVGLKAGAGFKVFARFRVNDPRKLIRRSVDTAVDAGVAEVLGVLPEGPARSVLNELRTPAKIALRVAFELGMTLAENQGQFNQNDAGKIALRCVQVGLEEGQRFLLEQAVSLAFSQLRTQLRDLRFDNAIWNDSVDERRALADRLSAMPEEPFEATPENQGYWTAVITEATAVGLALAGGGSLPTTVIAQLALLWSGTQLLFASVRRISEGQARASMLDMSATSAVQPFSGTLPEPPPNIQNHINGVLERDASSSVSQGDVVTFLVRTLQNNPLITDSPEVAATLRIITGPRADAVSDALQVVFSNLGAFASGANGDLSAPASLEVLRDGLQAYLDTRIEGELRPALIRATGGNSELQTFIDEVVLSTLHTITGPVFDCILDWRNGDHDNQRALRELCSSLLLRLLGRSLIVVGDVLLARAQGSIQAKLRQLAQHVNDSDDSIAPVMASLTRLDRDTVAEIIEETLLICADTFGPMSENKRARIRALLYRIIDTAPSPNDSDPITPLRDAAMVPNFEAAVDLAMLLGEEIVGNLLRFVASMLTHICALILAELQRAIAFIQETITEWVEELEKTVEKLLEEIGKLRDALAGLKESAERAILAALAQARNLLGFLADNANSGAELRAAISDFAVDKGLVVLKENVIYKSLPPQGQALARDLTREAVEGLLDVDWFDPIITAVGDLAEEAEEFLDEFRSLRPGDDIAAIVAGKFLDRFEAAIDYGFGGQDRELSFSITLLGVVIPLSVPLPLDELISALRTLVTGMSQFQDFVASLTGALFDAIAKQDAVKSNKEQTAIKTTAHKEATGNLAETESPRANIAIVTPQPGTVIEGNARLSVKIEGITARYLGRIEGEQQRVFVWINQIELPTSSITVTEFPPELPTGTRTESFVGSEDHYLTPEAVSALGLDSLFGSDRPIVAPTQNPPGSEFFFRSEGYFETPFGVDTVTSEFSFQDEAQASIRQPNDRPQRRSAARRPARKAAARRMNRSTLATTAAHAIGQPGFIELRGSETIDGELKITAGSVLDGSLDSKPAGGGSPRRGGVMLDATIPSELLDPGNINTIVCAIVPGLEKNRVQQSVSFLLVDNTERPSGSRKVPYPPVWKVDSLPPHIVRLMKVKLGQDRLLEPTKVIKVTTLAPHMWFPRKSERAARVEQTIEGLKQRLTIERDKLVLTRKILTGKKFRAVTRAKTAEKNSRKKVT